MAAPTVDAPPLNPSLLVLADLTWVFGKDSISSAIDFLISSSAIFYHTILVTLFVISWSIFFTLFSILAMYSLHLFSMSLSITIFFPTFPYIHHRTTCSLNFLATHTLGLVSSGTVCRSGSSDAHTPAALPRGRHIRYHTFCFPMVHQFHFWCYCTCLAKWKSRKRSGLRFFLAFVPTPRYQQVGQFSLPYL